MIEWDAHTDNPEKGLSHVVAFDKLIRELSTTVSPNDTLLLYTADYSFDFRVHGGGPDRSLVTGWEEWQKKHAGQSAPRFGCLTSVSRIRTRVKKC
jgi:alkaline phosphatase